MVDDFLPEECALDEDPPEERQPNMLLAWKGACVGGENAFWAGTDQMFGLLVELQLWSWAEVAFFMMQRDGDLADLPDEALW